MNLRKITPENSVFVLVSFEGPDSYSNAGGLGSRMTYLSRALVESGFETHLFYIGDPDLPGEESRDRLVLHRWCQWISKYHPLGVYDGEEGKLSDFNRSLPKYLVNSVVGPLAGQGKRVIIMAEEWHTAETVSLTSELLHERKLRDSAIIFWNANNTYSFHRIDWGRLKTHATITTVSRYMRQIMEWFGVSPLVISNGIPMNLIQSVGEKPVRDFKKLFNKNADLVLFKMARFDDTKGWFEAVEAAALLKRLGYRVLMLIRGGIETYGQRVLHRAWRLGLKIGEVDRSSTVEELLESLTPVVKDSDIINIRSYLPQLVSKALYAASHAVLANSRHEPFGLVGLESMASGGLSVVGGTGEDYARHLENSIVLDNASPYELVANILFLNDHPALLNDIRRQARSTAVKYDWTNVISNQLVPKLEFSSWEKSAVSSGIC